MRSALSVCHLRKSFGDIPVFQDFNMDISEGDMAVLFGPNGSGKSTLLNILSGVLSRDGGSVDIGGVHRFHISYIFQNYRDSLFPWRTNFENVILPLEIRKENRKAISSRMRELQELFEFDCPWDGYPYQLSGGEQQIVAFMRALITHPRILLIDEPFSALDYENNLRLREHLQRYALVCKPTILLVTHNIEEAVHLGNRIFVFSRRPTVIAGEIENTLPYPRTLESLKTEAFHRTKDLVLELFQREARL